MKCLEDGLFTTNGEDSSAWLSCIILFLGCAWIKWLDFIHKLFLLLQWSWWDQIQNTWFNVLTHPFSKRINLQVSSQIVYPLEGIHEDLEVIIKNLKICFRNSFSSFLYPSFFVFLWLSSTGENDKQKEKKQQWCRAEKKMGTDRVNKFGQSKDEMSSSAQSTISRLSLVYLCSISWLSLDSLSTMSWPSLNYLSTNSGLTLNYLDQLLSISRVSLHYLSTISQPSLEYLSTDSRPPLVYLLTISRLSLNFLLTISRLSIRCVIRVSLR